MNKLYLIMLLELLSASTIAGTMGSINSHDDWRIFGALSGGPVWADNTNTQTFQLTPNIIKTYVAQSNSQNLGTGEIFIGFENNMYNYFRKPIMMQWGVAYSYTNAAELKGIIWDDASPLFDNYSYQYKLQHMHVGIKVKLLADIGYYVMPWISGSVNAGFNRSYTFINAPLIPEAVANPNFTDHTKTALGYTLGLGLQKQLNENLQAGLGYEFADWGKSNLGRAAGQTLNKGLTLDNFYTHALLFNITYLI